MNFPYETPLILRMRSCARHPLPLISTVLFFLLGIVLALHPLVTVFSVNILLLAVAAFLTCAGSLTVYLSAEHKSKPLPGVGFGLSGLVSLGLAVAMLVLAVVERGGILSIIEYMISYAPHLAFLPHAGYVLGAVLVGMSLCNTVAWFLLRDTVRNNRPHRVLPVLAALPSALYSAVLIADSIYVCLRYHVSFTTASVQFLYGISLLWLFAAANLLGGITFIFFSANQKEKAK